MMKKYLLHILYIIASATIMYSCSTTSTLLEEERLYTGIDKIKVQDKLGTDEEETALTEVIAALQYAPNGSIMNSSTAKSPLQIGLWTYNALIDKHRTGFNKWLFDSFAAPPVTIDHVSPDTRTQVASNLLQNYGYFRGNVDYTLIEQKNPKKQKIAYDIKLGKPYLYDSIEYKFQGTQDSLIQATLKESEIKRGKQFSTLGLTEEKDRITSLFHNNGFYYFRPDYILYFADSIQNPYQLDMRIVPDMDMPEKAMKQYYFGDVSAYIRKSVSRSINQRSNNNKQSQGKDTLQNTSAQNSYRRLMQYDDSLVIQNLLKVAYQGSRMPIKPRVLFKNFKFWSGRVFDQSKVDKTMTNLYNMNIFSNVKFTFTPQDSTLENNKMDVRLDLTMDKLIDTELNMDFTQKSNSQIGPRFELIFSKRNAFYHGETLSIGINGSYEWQTQKSFGEERVNSYELGVMGALKYPWIAFPWLNKKIYKYPTSTNFEIRVNQLNRANYYRLHSFMAEAKYGFQTSRSWSHELTPLTISYNKMRETSARFDSIISVNPGLGASLRDQFIPAMQYKIIYDNVWNKKIQHTMHFEGSVKESGNGLNAVNAILKHPYNEVNKRLLWTTYSQFLKFNFELKNTFHLTEYSSIATRVLLGGIWSYGNSRFAPFSENFYIGGANSLRAFAVRSIGPGGYRDKNGRLTYIDQAGDMKIEFNAEYRFPIVKELQGALFIDAGNVWLMRDDHDHENGNFLAKNFIDQLAVGTGLGFRYDLSFLMLRFDIGVGIHAPYDTGKNSYYNINKFKDAVAVHLAVGYPF